MRCQPASQAGEGEGEELLEFRAVQRGVGRARWTRIVQARSRLHLWIQARPALGEDLADLPARETLGPCQMVESGLTLDNQFPRRRERSLRLESGSEIHR